ncbi:Sodium/hydrogen exchanger family-domain-containing protein [Xylogone sp. PMI_703]|nr:Sodium/hydrogen exchanger family-domain-containing protein [Xylogone sp. PMI_703]
MMRIPGFQENIFPTAANANLNLVANIGLILFLFLVALEVDIRLFLTNWRAALSVGLAGMILPFGLGCAISVGLYHQFRTDSGLVPIEFPVYMLFIGTALSITAFPVLCRILTELKLLGTPVGVTTLAAGVGNDVTGWILLALCVALVNNGSGITALWVLLCAAGWLLFLVFIVRPPFMWLLRRTGSLQNGPTQSMVALTILMVMTSAWFTGIIGIHPIFGGFLVGVICPHDGGFAIKLTEKIEDLVSVFFLPLYFALSGLSTNLGLLNDGIAWAYVVGIISVAFAGKIIGGTLAARYCNMVWRESLTVGVLMSCKGLVELIVLNIGFQAKILSQRTFTMFVVMALVTTVATTPLTSWLYPPWYQRKLEAWKRGEIDWEGNRLSESEDDIQAEKIRNHQVRRLLVYLRLDSLPGLFTFITLLGGDKAAAPEKVHKTKDELATATETEVTTLPKRPLEVYGVRMLELTERASSVMQVAEEDEYAYRDPVVNTFRTFAQLHNVAASGTVSVVPESSYGETLTSKASDVLSDLVLLPWSESGSLHDGSDTLDYATLQDRFTGTSYTYFVQQALSRATCNTAVFINRGFGAPRIQKDKNALSRTFSNISARSRHPEAEAPILDRSHHIYFPFFGGVDDRVALRFVLQLAQNSNVTATIVHFVSPLPSTVIEDVKHDGATSGGTSVTEAARDAALLHTLRDSLASDLSNRVVFTEVNTSEPLADAITHAAKETGQSPRNAGDLIILGRGHSDYLHSLLSHVNTADIIGFVGGTREIGGSEIRKTLGAVAEGILNSSAQASVLVIQAGGEGLEA